MSHVRQTLVLWSLGLLLFGCTTPTDDTKTLDEAAISEIETAVAARMDELITFAEALDFESHFALFDPSGPGSYIGGTHRYASLQELRDVVDAAVEEINVASQDFGEVETRVFVLSPDVAVTSSVCEVSHTDKLGVVYQPRPLAMTYVWVREDDQWKVHSYQLDVEPLNPRDVLPLDPQPTR